MRLALISSEAFPLVKVGGLADAVGGLAQALSELGFTVTIYLPWYSGIEGRAAGSSFLRWGGKVERVFLGHHQQDRIRFVLIGLPDFLRGNVYGYDDDVIRFLRFSLATAELLGHQDRIHVHDWPAALLPLLHRRGWFRAPTILTIHNLAHQGWIDPQRFFQGTGLPEALTPQLSHRGAINLLKAGLLFADRLTTVSPTYAQEILTPRFGEGLEEVLQEQRHKLQGILNGLDTRYWDPAQDPHLPRTYSLAHLEGKAFCEEALAQELGLEPPILGVVSRLVYQKGIDLILAALPGLLQLGFSLAILGSGEPNLEAALQEAAQRFPRRLAFRSGYHEGLAHRIYAGSTAFLMPSRFEPCGISQMIAMRYGTPPIAHATGGLKDTILHERTGILFEEADPEGLLWGVRRFLELDRHALINEAMAQEFSWQSRAEEYAKIYRGL